MEKSLIHLQVPAATKGRWIKASRAQGMKLSDWITAIVEAHLMQQTATITIPDTIRFADLHLARTPDGDVCFDWPPIERICEANDLPVGLLKDGPEDMVTSLIVRWYLAQLADGGARDAVADDLISETVAEDQAGQSISHRPGRA